MDRTALSESTVSVTLNEYGRAIGLTAKLRATGLVDVDAGAVNVVAYDLINSLDTVARDVVVAGTNADQSGDAGSKGAIDTSDTFASSDVRTAVAKLRGRSAVPIRDGYYVAHIHPDVSFDLREEAGSNANWREAHIYASPETIFAGEIGAYEGAIFIETPRAAIEADAGSGTTDVYKTVFLGQEYLAKAVAIEPHIVQSPVTDRLRRLPGIGWYFLGNWGRFREESAHRYESASSLGDN